MTKLNERPFLLVSSRVTEETAYRERRSSLAYDYVTYFEKLEFAVVPIPSNTAQVEIYFQITPQAVVLTGGNTIANQPSEGGITENLAGVYPERDEVESQLIEIAIREKIPVLGICRGMQLINRYFGGRIQHGIKNHVGQNHRLEAPSCSVLDGKTTNSFHGDGLTVDDVARDLKIIATSVDNIVEAIAHPDHRILGVQWHPERQARSFDDLIISNFIRKNACPLN